MLFKLSIASIKSKLKDYIVLLLGLVMAIAIFYMFETIALNKEFIKENAILQVLTFVFQLGSILLGAITVFYCFFANSFLFTLRQKEFGMYMTLGAKKRKLSLIMFIETIIIGGVSIVIGMIVGVFLSQIVGDILMDQLEFHSNSYKPYYPQSIIITIIFFTILFLISALFNSIKLSRLTILKLLKGESISDKVVIKKIVMSIQVILSLILLAVGYYCLIQITKTKTTGLIVAASTIAIGTYLFFTAFLPFIVQKKRNHSMYNGKGINSFTYAQLSFRINQLSKVLATVAMLTALGVGAMAVGFNFHYDMARQMEKKPSYDVSVLNPTKEQTKLINSMEYKEKFAYNLKVVKNKVYFNASELKAHKPIRRPPLGAETKEKKHIKAEPSMKNEDWGLFLSRIVQYNVTESTVKDAGNRANINILPDQEFQKIPAKKQTHVLGMTTDFMKNKETFKKIDRIEAIKYSHIKDYISPSKYNEYVMGKSVSAGTVFMGFFLGIAFFAIMASCLMFKVLTSATNDTRRYQMLHKLGVHRKLLSRSIYKELFLIFLFPAIMGIIHVTIGMLMFKTLFENVYDRFYVPILLFLAVYAVYYFITVWLYKGIVLKKIK